MTQGATWPPTRVAAATHQGQGATTTTNSPATARIRRSPSSTIKISPMQATTKRCTTHRNRHPRSGAMTRESQSLSTSPSQQTRARGRRAGGPSARKTRKASTLGRAFHPWRSTSVRRRLATRRILLKAKVGRQKLSSQSRTPHRNQRPSTRNQRITRRRRQVAVAISGSSTRSSSSSTRSFPIQRTRQAASCSSTSPASESSSNSVSSGLGTSVTTRASTSATSGKESRATRRQKWSRLSRTRLNTWQGPTCAEPQSCRRKRCRPNFWKQLPSKQTAAKSQWSPI